MTLKELMFEAASPDIKEVAGRLDKIFKKYAYSLVEKNGSKDVFEYVWEKKGTEAEITLAWNGDIESVAVMFSRSGDTSSADTSKNIQKIVNDIKKEFGKCVFVSTLGETMVYLDDCLFMKESIELVEFDIKKGLFHKWAVAKGFINSMKDKIDCKAICIGLKDKDPHVRKMANFARNFGHPECKCR